VFLLFYNFAAFIGSGKFCCQFFCELLLLLLLYQVLMQLAEEVDAEVLLHRQLVSVCYLLLLNLFADVIVFV